MPRRRIALLALICLGLAWLASPALGEWGPNLTQLRQAVQKNPQNPEANYKLGMKYQELGRPRQAAKYLKEAIRLKPDYPEALKALGKLNDQQGNLGAAVKDFGKELKLKPNDAELRNRVSNEQNKQGIALLKEGNLKDAEAAFQQAAKNDPKSPGPINNLGIAYFRAGRRDEAIRSFQDAISRDPNSADAHYNLGLSYLAEGNRVAAYSVYFKLRELNPELAHQLDILTSPPRTPVSLPNIE
jgi:protein O-GlcNAc transferase